jgi:polynucleotide 5'-kinase involved in rRNA processing
MRPKPRYFFNRTKLIEEACTRFECKRILILYGKAGSGKSTLARHYGERFLSSGGHVREMKCEPVRKMFENLIDLLGEPTSQRYIDPETNTIDRNKLFNDAKQLLETMCAENKRILFIFDNIDFFHRMNEFFVALPAQVKILVSSRNEELVEAFSENEADCMRVGDFTRQEFECFLKQALESKKETLNEQQIESLFNIVSYSADNVRSLNANRSIVLVINNINVLHIEDLIRLIRQNEIKLFIK